MPFYVEAIIGFIAFFVIGFVCLFLPQKVQDFVVRYYTRHTIQARFNPFLRGIRTPYYLLELRFVGIVAMLGTLILLLVIIEGLR